MKNAASLKSKAETPKTPGGISKSLLTPCRRIGLSRNWKKGVVSPFNSPLASPQVKPANDGSRKRKECEDTPAPLKSEEILEEENLGTPVRKVDAPKRKKSKTLLNNITKTEEDCLSPETSSENVKLVESEENIVATPVRLKSKSKSRSSLKSNKDVKENCAAAETSNENIEKNNSKEKPTDILSTPVLSKSKCNSESISPKNSHKRRHPNTDSNMSNNSIDNIVEKENIAKTNLEDETPSSIEYNTNHILYIEDESPSPNLQEASKEKTGELQKLNEKKSPNNLTKECIVVLQKKIFKNLLKEQKDNTASQALFNDSDDDIPLKNLNTDTNYNLKEDEDFKSVSKPNKNKTPIKEKVKILNKKVKETTKPIKLQTSQSSIDDDDFFEKKKTILIKKTYDKVVKPSKAKSTGSITQKDIEDLKAKIETKKKLLLAKSMTDTKELRELIKKWQKGCQDALMELMDLMKNKCPEQHMEYSQILESLKIPATLVGYDSDNDCFVTPEDENIILSHIKE